MYRWMNVYYDESMFYHKYNFLMYVYVLANV